MWAVFMTSKMYQIDPEFSGRIKPLQKWTNNSTELVWTEWVQNLDGSEPNFGPVRVY